MRCEWTVAVLSLSLAVGGAQRPDPAGRPWATSASFLSAYAERARTASSPEDHFALAEWCDARGLLIQSLRALEQVLAREPDHAAARARMGQVRSEGTWRFEECVRGVGATASWRLPALDAKRRKELLRLKEREFEDRHRGSFFKVWTDVSFEELQPYSAALNEYYRNLNTRFRAYSGEKIDFLLFGNRSDYLSYYADATGKSGLHVGGFFLPSTGSIVLYSDPSELKAGLNTARHECTHLLAHRCFGGAPIPPWLDEGLACYLAGDGPSAQGEYTAGLLIETQAQIRERRFLPLAELMELESEQFRYEHYATSWSWVYFLNEGLRGERFQKCLLELRKALPEDVDETGCREQTTSVLKLAFASEWNALQSEWETYFKDTFALGSAEQMVEYGLCSLREARVAEGEQARDYVDRAQVAISQAAAAAEEDVHAELAWAEIETTIAHLEVSDLDAIGARFGLRSVLRRIGELGGEGDASRRASVALQALYVLRRIVDVEIPAKGSFDLRAALVDQLASGDSSARPLAEATIVLLDDLTACAAENLRRVLEQNPLDRRALESWIWLAQDFMPPALESAFPFAQLQVEVTPDDVNLALLGVVYAGLGDAAWGRWLLSEAKRRSPAGEVLERFHRLIP